MTRHRKRCVALAKEIAKIRDGRVCQWCMKLTSGHDCQGSHIIPESTDSKLSCDPTNIKTLCYRCHTKRHEHPIEAYKWISKKRPKRIAYLQEEHKKINGTIGVQYFIDKEIELKAQLKKMSSR